MTVKNLIEQVEHIFGRQSEGYMFQLINDALVEMGYYSNKIAHAKISAVANQMWYDLSDGAEDSSGNKLELNKVKRVYLMDSEGDYIQIPRLTDTNLLLTDITSESALEAPD